MLRMLDTMITKHDIRPPVQYDSNQESRELFEGSSSVEGNGSQSETIEVRACPAPARPGARVVRALA